MSPTEPNHTEQSTKQLNIRIENGLRERLVALSKARYTSVSALVREGILLLLETDPKGVLPNNLAGPVLTKAIELGELLVTRTPEQANQPAETTTQDQTSSVSWSG